MKAEEVLKIAVEAVKIAKTEELREKKSKVFRNTKLLMQNYNGLKNHVSNAIDDIRKIESDIYDDDELFILSIKRSKAKTLIMLAHIEICLELLKEKYSEAGTHEKYKALVLHYLEGKSFEEIQQELNCGKNTPGRWINQAIADLGVYLFGIDGLKMVI